MSEEKKRNYDAQARYNAKTRRRVALNLNTNTDPDILEHLEKLDNVQGYLKQLIRADMARKSEQGRE